MHAMLHPPWKSCVHSMGKKEQSVNNKSYCRGLCKVLENPQSTVQVQHADKLGLTKHFINFYRALVIQVAKRNSGLTCNNKWKLWNQFLWHLTQHCFQQWQFWMFIFNFLMKGNGVGMMLLFVRWCDSE